MVTSHLMTGKHIPHLGLNSLISTLSFDEIFSYFATSWKWYCLTFWIGKKWRLFRRFFQYSVICHFSKYITLALTDFHKNMVFYRECMRSQLRQVSKKFTEGNTRKFTVSISFCAHVDVIKSKNTPANVFLWARADYLSFRHQCACNGKTLGSLLNSTNGTILCKTDKRTIGLWFDMRATHHHAVHVTIHSCQMHGGIASWSFLG